MKVKWQWNQIFKENLIKEVLIWVIKMPTRGGGGMGMRGTHPLMWSFDRIRSLSSITNERWLDTIPRSVGECGRVIKRMVSMVRGIKTCLNVWLHSVLPKWRD
jgi:hypothetical protein